MKLPNRLRSPETKSNTEVMGFETEEDVMGCVVWTVGCVRASQYEGGAADVPADLNLLMGGALCGWASGVGRHNSFL